MAIKRMVGDGAMIMALTTRTSTDGLRSKLRQHRYRTSSSSTSNGFLLFLILLLHCSFCSVSSFQPSSSSSLPISVSGALRSRSFTTNPLCLLQEASSSSSSSATTTTSVPPPPWNFEASRIFYQFQAIPVDNARTFCPPCNNESTSSSSPLVLLSLGGYTLGGIFCVEYENSPIGPYREVAILSSLVVRRPQLGLGSDGSGLVLPAIGAWASHIFVDSQDAADYGKEFWGLPATVVPNIQFTSEKLSSSSSAWFCQFSDEKIVVSGWEEEKTSDDGMEWLDIALPSFSGLLPLLEDQDDVAIGKPTSSPLLQYPLSIIRPSSIGFADPKSILFGNDGDKGNTLTLLNDDSSSRTIKEVQLLLNASRPLIAANIGSVNLVAGIPTKVVDC